MCDLFELIGGIVVIAIIWTVLSFGSAAPSRKSWVSECTKTRTFEACNQDFNALQNMDK